MDRYVATPARAASGKYIASGCGNLRRWIEVLIHQSAALQPEGPGVQSDVAAGAEASGSDAIDLAAIQKVHVVEHRDIDTLAFTGAGGIGLDFGTLDEELAATNHD